MRVIHHGTVRLSVSTLATVSATVRHVEIVVTENGKSEPVARVKHSHTDALAAYDFWVMSLRNNPEGFLRAMEKVR